MPRKGGFTSYVDPDGTHPDFKAIPNVTSDENLQIADVQPSLLQGEMVISKAVGVLRFTPYTDQKQGNSGCLFCTNFKLSFITSETTSTPSVLGQKHKLISENDIVLNNIDATYQVSKSGKKKRLYPGAYISGNKLLEIHCKDFRIVTFCFKFTPKHDAKLISTAIIHHAFPTRLELLFLFEYKGNTDPDEGGPPRFRNVTDWEEELKRLHVNSYKAIQFNTGFKTCDNLPEVIVVPATLSNPDVCSAAQQYIGYRVPTWSFSLPSGAALIRMANLIPETSQRHLETRIIDCIATAHPKQRKPVIYDLGQVLTSVKDIKISFEKLRDLCMPASTLETWDSDSTWYSALDGTRWLHIVGDCLQVAFRVADRLLEANESVIIKEADARDLTAVVSSLAQLLLDPYSRTIQGFQSLIEKEWVALGHRFTDRCGLLHNTEQEQCPVFLLFLDCVWQLTQQFPTAFQFSQTYLTSLWDSVNLGLFENFAFNSERERLMAPQRYSVYTQPSAESGPKHMSVWDWSKQFDKDFLSLGRNPLYMTKTDMKLRLSEDLGDLDGVQNGTNVAQLRKQLYRLKLNGLFETVPKSRTRMLRPVVQAPRIQFWAYCYLRWVGPLQVVGGGSIMEYLQQCILVEDITVLQHRIHTLESSTTFVKADRRKSSLLFSFMTPQGVDGNQEMVTSSFPYVSGATPTHASYSGTPLKLFLDNSLICESTEDLDDIS